ncbi:MAG: hypothetical protein KL787_10985 [Taibaiella sp.]|nr:hypothetical protein [Taibaiella sp.]
MEYLMMMNPPSDFDVAYQNQSIESRIEKGKEVAARTSLLQRKSGSRLGMIP